MCGSDEGNIRMWKSVAWRKEGNLNFRQRASQNYADKLKQKFKHHPEIKRIARHRHVPKVSGGGINHVTTYAKIGWFRYLKDFYSIL